MKKRESLLITETEAAQLRLLGERINRLRIARRMTQLEASLRAGVSRPTARKIERGDPGRTLGQVMRYLGAIAPGVTLLAMIEGRDPAILALEAQERRVRSRRLTEAEMAKVDF
jgi:transcriptional regulator with XRE-family HTH domain